MDAAKSQIITRENTLGLLAANNSAFFQKLAVLEKGVT